MNGYVPPKMNILIADKKTVYKEKHLKSNPIIEM